MVDNLGATLRTRGPMVDNLGDLTVYRALHRSPVTPTSAQGARRGSPVTPTSAQGALTDATIITTGAPPAPMGRQGYRPWTTTARALRAKCSVAPGANRSRGSLAALARPLAHRALRSSARRRPPNPFSTTAWWSLRNLAEVLFFCWEESPRGG